MQLAGIHHLTAISAKPRENLAFYTGLLGMRLVKKTVNQDDVSAYHLFYADGKANPGTDLTFFLTFFDFARRRRSQSWLLARDRLNQGRRCASRRLPYPGRDAVSRLDAAAERVARAQQRESTASISAVCISISANPTASRSRSPPTVGVCHR